MRTENGIGRSSSRTVVYDLEKGGSKSESASATNHADALQEPTTWFSSRHPSAVGSSLLHSSGKALPRLADHFETMERSQELSRKRGRRISNHGHAVQVLGNTLRYSSARPGCDGSKPIH